MVTFSDIQSGSKWAGPTVSYAFAPGFNEAEKQIVLKILDGAAEVTSLSFEEFDGVHPGARITFYAVDEPVGGYGFWFTLHRY